MQGSGAAEEGAGDVERVRIGEREFVLVGTAHVSRESVDLVRRTIEAERPDTVCIELDAQRFQALAQEKRWRALDLRQVIRERQLAPLIANLLLASYQKKLGGMLGVSPGTELLEAARVAEEQSVPVELCDRDVRVTMRRAWASISFWEKTKLLAEGIAGGLEAPALDEDELRRLRSRDVLTELMSELGRALPGLKRVLIDERDTYLAERIRRAPGRRIVAVVGAGHVAGMRAALEAHRETDLAPLEVVPPASPVWRWVGWGVPALILGSLAAIAWTKGPEAAGQNLAYWVLANGIPSTAGAALALAHPLTIVAAFFVAPITSLTPVIGAGYVLAFVQAWLQPPRVAEFESVTEEAGRARSWWSNRLLRILLVFVLTTLGSLLGTYVGGVEIVSNLF